MEVRFYIDPETGQPHIYNHGVSEEEVRQVLARSGEDRPAAEGARNKLGQTAAGRYLKVVYKVDEVADLRFVITAYEMGGKARKAFRRRRRRRK